MSGNLGLVPIAESQSNKHVTANTALLRIADAVTAILSVSVASGNATVSTAEFQQAVKIQITGAGTAGRTVTLPAVQRGLVVISAHDDNTESVEVVRGSASLVLLPGEVAICATDGTTNGFAGYVLANSGAPPTLETLTDVEITAPADGEALVYDASDAVWRNGVPSGGGGSAGGDLAPFFGGTLASSEILYRLHTRTAWTLLASSGNSPKATVTVAATGSTTVTLKKNGGSIGTLVWAASGTVATVTISSAASFSADDIFTIEAPATADATLANVSVTLPFTWN